jgi:hypothetical protein
VTRVRLTISGTARTRTSLNLKEHHEMNFPQASYLSWLTRNLRLGVDPTVALGYE